MFSFFAKWLDPDIDDAILQRQFGPTYAKVNRQLGILLLLLLCGIPLFISIVVAQLKTPPTQLFALTPDQKVRPITSLSIPVYSVDRIKNWSSLAVKEIYTANFSNVNEKVHNNRRYFTPNGVKLFDIAGQDQIEDITTKHLDVVLTPISSPYILAEWKQANGMSAWKVEVSALIISQGSFGEKQKGPIVTKKVVSLTILQVPTVDNPSGLEIASLTLDTPKN